MSFCFAWLSIYRQAGNFSLDRMAIVIKIPLFNMGLAVVSCRPNRNFMGVTDDPH
jgi:hypothetical protein